MLYRPQHGGLDDSMREVVTLDPTFDALARYLDVDINDISIQYYGEDSRIGWDTYCILVNYQGWGFTDEEPTYA
jgi:hypothetical protein